MDLFSSQNIEKMVAEHDLDGLYRLLDHRNRVTRMEAAQALAEMNDGAGWRYLMETVRQTEDSQSRQVAAAILGDLGHQRAIPVLEEALKQTKGEAAGVFKEALVAIGGSEADEALRRAGFEPVLPHMGSSQQIVSYEGDYVRAPRPGTGEIEFLTAEQHFSNAASLRESELAERGLVENSLALWLSPEWAYAWYLRGVLFEDLDRFFEASLCYRWSLELDPSQEDTRFALTDLEAEQTFPALDAELLMVDLGSNSWEQRRDAAAGLGEIGVDAPEVAVDRLLALIDDEDKEVRHAVIEALGNIENQRADQPLSQHEESPWLLRFAVIEALAQIGSVDGLAVVLQREMDRFQEHNPIFSSNKDPMLEVEYDRLLEVGVLAFEKTGDIEALLARAESNTWIEVEEDEGDNPEVSGSFGLASLIEQDANEEEPEADEDLGSYVDEVALMSSLALQRLAMTNLASLNVATLRRLAAVPDLTLLDVSESGKAEEAQEAPEIVHDLAPLREAAKVELGKR